MRNLILASSSPRRAQLLEQIGVSFEQVPAELDETKFPGETPEEYVQRLAREKSALVQSGIGSDSVVLAADTAVVLDDLVLGKPADHFDGLGMLARLSGREHRVLTAICLRCGDVLRESLSESRVRFINLTREQCEAYLATDEPWDKAGSYAIQGVAGAFVESMEGSYSGVVGLPLAETCKLLQELDVPTALER